MEPLDFPTTAYYTKEDIKKVQARLLEIAKIATSILERNHIQYFIGGGTLLGAVRHHGFIPWDDDFDLFLLDEEYENALQCLRQELPRDIIVHDRKTDYTYWHAWTKLKDANTKAHSMAHPDDNVYPYTGLSLDLFRLEKRKKSQLEAYWQQSKIEFLVRKYDAGLINDERYHELFTQWTREYTEIIEHLAAKTVSDSEVYTSLTSLCKIEKEDIFPLQKYSFEDTLFWGPAHYDTILTQGYGAYMQIPNYENRKTVFDRVEYRRN